MKSMFGYGSTTIGPEQPYTNKLNTNNVTDNSSLLTEFIQTASSQISEIPKYNFNINLFRPNSFDNNIEKKKKGNKQLKINFSEKEDNLILMVKNEDNDNIDSKGLKDKYLNQLRPRTLSI